MSLLVEIQRAEQYGDPKDVQSALNELELYKTRGLVSMEVYHITKTYIESLEIRDEN